MLKLKAIGDTKEQCLAKVEELKARDFMPLHDEPKYIGGLSRKGRPHWFVMMQTVTSKPPKR